MIFLFAKSFVFALRLKVIATALSLLVEITKKLAKVFAFYRNLVGK